MPFYRTLAALIVTAVLPVSALTQESEIPVSESTVAADSAPSDLRDSTSLPDKKTASKDVANLSPDELKRELETRLQAFHDKRLELEKAIGDQREIYIRYVNLEANSPERLRAYVAQRNRVRERLDETYAAALSVAKVGFDQEAATFMATMIQHRLKRDIYDRETLEGATWLIDNGSRLRFLFEAAARSAVVVGEFRLAKQIYEVMEDENQEEVDQLMEVHLEEYQKQFEAEAALRSETPNEDRLPRVRLQTTQGDVVVELFLEEAPSAVAHFLRLVEEGFYNGVEFYQVIDHLLALTGDPTSSGSGNSGQFLIDEHDRPNARKGLRGSLVMAKLPRPDQMSSDPSGGTSATQFIPHSASSQFAILLLPVPAISAEQTVFGTVVEGMDAISRLRRVDPNEKKKPDKKAQPPDMILEAEVIRRPESLPAPRYVDLENVSSTAAR